MKTIIISLALMTTIYISFTFYSVYKGGLIKVDLMNTYENNIKKIQSKIENSLSTHTSIEPEIYTNIKTPYYQYDIKVTEKGEIFFQALSPSILVIYIPSITNGKVTWSCVSAPQNISGVMCAPMNSLTFMKGK